MLPGNNLRRALGILFLFGFAATLALFPGCKASDNIIIHTDATNTVAIIPTNTPLLTITNAPSINITNSDIKVTVTNEFGEKPTNAVVVTLTNVLATNLIEVKAMVDFTNVGNLKQGQGEVLVAIEQLNVRIKAMEEACKAKSKDGCDALWEKIISAAVKIITAVGGLVGVFATAAVFFHGKKLERQSVYNALLGEMRQLLLAVSSQWAWRETCNAAKEKENVIYPLITFVHPVYDKHVEKIGVLPNGFVAPVVEFYGFVNFLNRFQRTRTGYLEAQVIQKKIVGDKAEIDLGKTNKIEEFNAEYYAEVTKFLKQFGSKFAKEFDAAGIDPFIWPPPKEEAKVAKEEPPKTGA